MYGSEGVQSVSVNAWHAKTFCILETCRNHSQEHEKQMKRKVFLQAEPCKLFQISAEKSVSYDKETVDKPDNVNILLSLFIL